jgi:prepilin peptidase CpaA
MESLVQQLMFVGVALLCASIGAVIDLRERRIPNFLTLPAMAVGCMLHFALGSWRGLGDSALAGIIAGGLFLVFFLAGGMGAGDVKLMAAVGCIVGLTPIRSIAIATAIAGGLFALALSLYHRRLPETLHDVGRLLAHHAQHGLSAHPDISLANPRALRLPFALPITAGCLFTVCTLALEVWS